MTGSVSQGSKNVGKTAITILAGLLLVGGQEKAGAHVFIFEFHRIGAAPSYEGSGWIGEAFLNIPDEAAAHLLTAENYVRDLEPDFTFRTRWIDFPPGPVGIDLDTSFAKVGDFLINEQYQDQSIYDVSDPSRLDEPFGHLLLRFSGLLKVAFADDTVEFAGLPVWVELGTYGFDGYRTSVGETIYRMPIVDPNNILFHENAIIMATGLFPIQVTYFNRYDPENEHAMERAGIELYSWHGGGLPWPAGEQLVHATRGPATIVPPRAIYQAEDILPLIKGDYDADFDVDLLDFQWFQTCHTGPSDEPGGFFLGLGCEALDFDDDSDVDSQDFADFQSAVDGQGDGGGE